MKHLYDTLGHIAFVYQAACLMRWLWSTRNAPPYWDELADDTDGRR
jgi:hypothetical protein